MTHHLMYKRLLLFRKAHSKDIHRGQGHSPTFFFFFSISKHHLLNKVLHEKLRTYMRSVSLQTLREQPFEAAEANAIVVQKSEAGWKPDSMSH